MTDYQNQYKKFKIERLDPIGPTFCSAKWLQNNLFIHTGSTSSCCLTTPDKINLDQIKKNVLAIHNTDGKLQNRKEMLEGKQTKECVSCWNIENINSEEITQRTRFSYRYKDKDFTTLDLSNTTVPRSMAITFDSFCNFTCSYCDATQSSSWATDLKVNGPYPITADPKKTYQRLGKQDLLSQSDYDFLYSQTLEMISSNLNEIKNINVLGGEPTMSPTFWKFFDWLLTQPVHDIEFRVTTNLSHIKFIDRILESKKIFKDIIIQASIDGYGKKAEFIRHGLDWDVFEKNLMRLLDNNIGIKVELLGTTNILALDGLFNHLEWYSDLYNKFPDQLSHTISIVKWPVFQSITVLPESIRQYYVDNLIQWVEKKQFQFDKDKNLLNDISSIITLLQSSVTSANIGNLQKDFKTFVIEYAKRRRLDIKYTLDKILSDWILEENHGKTI